MIKRPTLRPLRLSLMNGIDRLNALDLDNYQILNDEIDPVTEVNLLAIVDDRQSNLASYAETLLAEFVQQASLISAFQ